MLSFRFQAKGKPGNDENKTKMNSIPNSVGLVIQFLFEDPFVLV